MQPAHLLGQMRHRPVDDQAGRDLVDRRADAGRAEILVELAPADDSSRFSDDDAEEVHHALDQLNLSDREALALYFLEELSVREIADVLGVPAGTVKSRLYFARKRLRQIMEKRHD